LLAVFGFKIRDNFLGFGFGGEIFCFFLGISTESSLCSGAGG
jgi:hypothetical protein